MKNQCKDSWKTIKVTKETISNLKISDKNKEIIYDIFLPRSEIWRCSLIDLFEITQTHCGLAFAMMVFSAFVKDGIINIDDF